MFMFTGAPEDSRRLALHAVGRRGEEIFEARVRRSGVRCSGVRSRSFLEERKPFGKWTDGLRVPVAGQDRSLGLNHHLGISNGLHSRTARRVSKNSRRKPGVAPGRARRRGACITLRPSRLAS